MANKIKNHQPEILSLVKTIASAIHAQFIANKMVMSQLVKQTGLSANSIKTILKGETANIASYLALAEAVGLSFLVAPKGSVIEDNTSKKSCDPSATKVIL